MMTDYPALPPGTGLPTISTATNRLPAQVEQATAAAPAFTEAFAQKPRSTAKAVGQNELMFNVADFGAKCDGVTDDGAAIDAAIAAIAAAGGRGLLNFPAGRTISSRTHVIAAGQKIVVQGAGRASTELRRANGATGDFWTLNEAECGIQHLSIDGRRYQSPSGGHNIVLNNAYAFVDDVFVNKARGDGIRLGVSGAAIMHSLTRLRVRECGGYGVYVVGGSESTDGIWSGVEVGLCGKAGVRLDTGSQNIAGLHVWGCGIETPTTDPVGDRAGVWANSQSNVFTNLQSETENGFGAYVTGSRNVISGGRIWGNMSTGIRGVAANYLVVTGVEFYRNAAANAAAGSTSLGFSAIYLTDTTYATITGNNVWDDATAFSSVSYVTAPAYPFPGRSAARSQAYGYAEDGASDFNVVCGNTMPRDLMRGSAGPHSFVGNSNAITGNQWGTGLTAPTRTVVAGAVRVPMETDVIYVNAGATITSVLGHRLGRHVTLLFNGSGTGSVTDDGDTLNLAGNLVTTPGVTLSLVSDGAKWRETSRSAL